MNLIYSIDLNTQCWNWSGPRHKGYGYLWDKTRKRTIKAHRYSYEYFKGPITSNLYVWHNCNNKLCINPNHLELKPPGSNLLRT